MPCTAACPGCHQQVNIPDELLGKQIRCSSCQTVFIVQAPQPAPGLSDFASIPLPQASFNSASPRHSQESAWRPSYQTGFDGGDFSNASSPPKRRTDSRVDVSDEEGGTSALAQFGILLIVVGIVGMILPLFGWELVRLRRLGPVGGGFIGLAGCGFVAIGYFMKNKPVHAILGSVLPGLILLTGIAGWLSVNSQSSEDDSEQASAPEQRTGFRDQVKTPRFPTPSSNMPRPGIQHEQHLPNRSANPSTGYQASPNSLGIAPEPPNTQKLHNGIENPISIPQPPSGFGPNGPNRARMNPGEAYRPPDFGPPPSGFRPSPGNMGPPRVSPPNFTPPPVNLPLPPR